MTSVLICLLFAFWALTVIGGFGAAYLIERFWEWRP